MKLIPHLRYLWYVIRHKWFVLLAGYKIRVPLWQLIIHDWSKFSKAEWWPYVRKFYTEQFDAYDEFDKAWLHHQHKNPHHWQHWVLRKDDGRTKIMTMPTRYVYEMVADWMGAGRAITGRWEVADWYEANKDKILLAPDTRWMVESILRDYASWQAGQVDAQ